MGSVLFRVGQRLPRMRFLRGYEEFGFSGGRLMLSFVSRDRSPFRVPYEFVGVDFASGEVSRVLFLVHPSVSRVHLRGSSEVPLSHFWVFGRTV